MLPHVCACWFLVLKKDELNASSPCGTIAGDRWITMQWKDSGALLPNLSVSLHPECVLRVKALPCRRLA